MAFTDMNLSGKVRKDVGTGLSGADVSIHQTAAALNGTILGSAVQTDSNGTFSITATTITSNYDVKISKGDSTRYIAWSDEIALKTVDTSVLKVRGATNAAAAPIYLLADLAGDPGDSWRIQATDSDTLAIGSDKAVAGTIIDYLTITNGANAAASNTTILGQLTIGVNDTGADVKFFGATSGKYWLWDESADGVVQIGTLTVGVDGTGHDVKFFGATSGQYLLWDESADELVLTGDTKLSFHDAAGGENIIASANGHLEVNAGTTLDITAPTVDLNSSTEFNIDTAAYDLNASGAIQVNSSGGALSVANDNVDQTVNLATGGTRTLNIGINDGTDVTTIASKGNVTQTGTITVGVNDTGYDVKLFGATSGAYLLWDESADKLLTAGGAVVDIVKDKLLIGGTAVTTTAAELNVLDAVTAGTVSASLGVVVDSNKDIGLFRNVTLSGELASASLDISGNVDIDGDTDLDAVDIDGAVQIDATFTSGVDGQGYDTKFFGDTSGAYILWDTSADKLLTAGGAVVDIVKDKLLIGGTAVTTTAAELNILDGVTSTAAELNILDGVTSTAAELNLVDGSSANSVVNSKAVIYGSSGELAGTLSTVAQANITSVGTLSDLTVSGTSTTIGTVTSGIWNAGAVTSSGDITASATGDRYLLVHSTNASIAGIELRRATTGDGNFDWFWEASGGRLLASYKGSGSKTLAWKLESNGDASFEGNDALSIGAAGNDFGASTLDLASGYEIAGAGGLTISSASGNFDINGQAYLQLQQGGTTRCIVQSYGLSLAADSYHADEAGTHIISIFNGTPPEGTLANGASIYCSGGVMKVINADGSGGTIDFS